MKNRFLCLSLVALFLSAPAFASPSLLSCALEALQGGGAETVPAPAVVDVAFSPRGGATDLVVKAIGSAKQRIFVAAYSFTSRPIAEALIAAHRAGVEVKVLVDHGQIEKSSHSVVGILSHARIPMRIDVVHAIQHDKYMVIDNKTVETGSFNFTAAAEQRNSENVIVLWDSAKLAAVYGENWQMLWDQAEPYGAN